MEQNKLYFKDWEIENLSFDAAKNRVSFSATRNIYQENYSYRKEIEFIYGIEEFLTNLNKMSANFTPNTNRDDIKNFLNNYNLTMII